MGQWTDPYRGQVTGTRYLSTHPDIPLARCMRDNAHDGRHRYTSSTDGASVSWEDPSGGAETRLPLTIDEEDE